MSCPTKGEDTPREEHYAYGCWDKNDLFSAHVVCLKTGGHVLVA
jgi:hypothetical protein